MLATGADCNKSSVFNYSRLLYAASQKREDSGYQSQFCTEYLYSLGATSFISLQDAMKRTDYVQRLIFCPIEISVITLSQTFQLPTPELLIASIGSNAGLVGL